jgi:hypothetical protein
MAPPVTVEASPVAVAAPVVSFRPATPIPISDADLADELRPPGLVQSLGRSRPSGGWFAIAFIAVAAAFVGGVALGRGTASRPVIIPVPEAPPAPKPVEATPPPSPEPKTASSADSAAAPPAPSALPEPKSAAPAKVDGPPFNAKAASTNLGIAAARAHGCHMRGDPAGNVSASVTFANSGRVSDVTIEAPHTGTKTALCVTYKLNTVRVPPYGGSPQTVTQAVTLK